MSVLILRRRRLGRSSTRGLKETMQEDVRVIRNDLMPTSIPAPDLVIRWGCTGSLPFSGVPILNEAAAIHTVSDKRGFRKVCLEEGHGLAPNTWFNKNDDSITFPCIVRPSKHHQGRSLYVCNDLGELHTACNRHSGGYYISELIDKVAEFRVFVVQGRVALVAEKTPGNPEDVAWNVARGGRFDNVHWDNWNLQAVRKSIEAFNLSGLDFAGVDVMVDANGQAYIIEINSAPSMPFNEDGTATYRHKCMSKCFDYISLHGKEMIPLVSDRGGYRKFIHPAITDRARLIGGA